MFSKHKQKSRPETKQEKIKSSLDSNNPGEVFFEDSINIESIENNMMFFEDGRISVGFELFLPDAESLSDADLSHMNDQLTNIVGQLPAWTAVHKQGIWSFSDNVLKSVKQDGFFTKKRTEFYNERKMLKCKTYLYLCYNFNNAGLKNPMSNSFSSKIIPKNVFENIEQDIKSVVDATKSFINQFNSLKGVKMKLLKTKDLFDRVYEYYNMEYGKEMSRFENNIDNSSANEVVIGPNVASFVTLTDIGETVYICKPNSRNSITPMTWGCGTEIYEPHIVNEVVVVGDTEKMLGKIDRKRKMINSLGQIVSQDNVVSNQMLEMFTGDLRKEGKKLAYMHHNVMLFSTDRKKLSNSIDQAKSIYNKMNSSLGTSSSHNAGQYFFTFSPGRAGDVTDTMIMPVDQALCFMDLTSKRQSDNDGIIMSDRELEPVLVDFWHEKLQSKNRIVIGPTGSGKSYAMNNLICQEYEQGVDVTIIDVGGSYKNIVEALKGKYYEYDVDNPIAFNPFLIPKNEDGIFHLSENKLVFLTSLINILWKDDGTIMNKEETAVLHELFEKYYEKANKENIATPRMDSFIEFVKEYVIENKKKEGFQVKLKKFDFDSLSLVLQRFISGKYAKILNADEDESISQYRLVCFDMASIKSDPILYPIVALVIVELVLDKIRTMPDVRKEIIMDEAWSMLAGGTTESEGTNQMAEFIENLFRTVRKNMGSVSIITQSVVELKASPVGEAIKNNAAIKILLDHSSQPSQVDVIKSYFGMTSSQTELFRNLRKQGNSWREMYIQFEEEARVYALEVDPHANAAFSSRSEDRLRIKQLKKEYDGNVEHAINQFVEETQQ